MRVFWLHGHRIVMREKVREGEREREMEGEGEGEVAHQKVSHMFVCLRVRAHSLLLL